jgi:hypothetical protein
MVAVDVEFPPFILTNPSLLIDGKELKCAANQIEHKIDQNTNDYDTFCGSYRSYGVERHTITVSLYQNFDTDGPWQVLSPLAGTLVDFELIPDKAAANGPTNPTMFGTVRVPAMPFLKAQVNEASNIDIDLSVQGKPSYAPPDTAPVTAAAAAPRATSSSGSTTPAA